MLRWPGTSTGPEGGSDAATLFGARRCELNQELAVARAAAAEAPAAAAAPAPAAEPEQLIEQHEASMRQLIEHHERDMKRSDTELAELRWASMARYNTGK